MAVIGCSFEGRSGFLKMEIHSIRCMSSSVSACDRAWKKWSNISDTSFIGWILQDSPQSMPKSKLYRHTWQSHVKIGRAYVKIDVGNRGYTYSENMSFLQNWFVWFWMTAAGCGWQRLCLYHNVTKTKPVEKKYQHLMFKTYDLCNSCAYICEPHLGMFDLVACCHRWVNETSQRRASVAVVMTVGSEPNCQQAGLGWWWWIMGTWWHQLRWRKYAMFFLFKTPPVSHVLVLSNMCFYFQANLVMIPTDIYI